jgi:hypothetical protein
LPLKKTSKAKYNDLIGQKEGNFLKIRRKIRSYNTQNPRKKIERFFFPQMMCRKILKELNKKKKAQRRYCPLGCIIIKVLAINQEKSL